MATPHGPSLEGAKETKRAMLTDARRLAKNQRPITKTSKPTVEEKPIPEKDRPEEQTSAAKDPVPPVEQVAAAVWLVRLPLPWPLAIVNVYLLEQQDGLLLIDCGVKTEEPLEVLSQALATLGRTFEDIRQIVVTHMHADHVGAAAELRRAAERRS